MASRSQISKPGPVTKSRCWCHFVTAAEADWGTHLEELTQVAAPSAFGELFLFFLRWTFKLFSQKFLGGLEDCGNYPDWGPTLSTPLLVYFMLHSIPCPLPPPFLSSNTIRSIGTCCSSLTKVPQLRKKVCLSESKSSLSLVIGIISLCLRSSKSSKHWRWEVRGNSVQANPIYWEPQMRPYLEILWLTWNTVLAGLHWALVLRGEHGAVPPWWHDLPYVRSQVPSLNTGRKEEKEEEMEGGKGKEKQKGKTQDTQRQAQKESPGMAGAQNRTMQLWAKAIARIEQGLRDGFSSQHSNPMACLPMTWNWRFLNTHSHVLVFLRHDFII